MELMNIIPYGSLKLADILIPMAFEIGIPSISRESLVFCYLSKKNKFIEPIELEELLLSNTKAKSGKISKLTFI